MTASRLLRYLIISAILLFNIGCDQVTKTMARKNIGYNERVEIFSHYLTLTKVENTGAFLSMGDSLPSPLKFIFLTLLPLLALGFGLIFIFSRAGLSKYTLAGLCFVIGGGMGNIFDRVAYGSVTDFLHMDLVVFETGIFNMADVSVMAGMFLILSDSICQKMILNDEKNSNTP